MRLVKAGYLFSFPGNGRGDLAARILCNFSAFIRVWKDTGTKTTLDALTLRPEQPAMLTALIIISLLSLLIATEAEPAGSAVEHAPELSPRANPGTCRPKDKDSDRLAA